MAIMSKAIASGTARMMDSIQIRAISMAIHFGTPIPLIRLHEATARYLEGPAYGVSNATVQFCFLFAVSCNNAPLFDGSAIHFFRWLLLTLLTSQGVLTGGFCKTFVLFACLASLPVFCLYARLG